MLDLSAINNVTLLVLACLLSVAAFENQRWIRARQRGLMGSSVLFGFFVDLTGFLNLLFGPLLLAAIAFDYSIAAAIIFAIVTFGIGLALTPISTFVLIRLFGHSDVPIIWFIGTLAVYPLIFLITTELSWFGLFGN